MIKYFTVRQNFRKDLPSEWLCSICTSNRRPARVNYEDARCMYQRQFGLTAAETERLTVS